MRWEPAAAPEVRSRIARAWLGAHGRDTLGSIVLRPHQRSAAGRLRALISAAGGALLADPVGSGKTYSALGAAHGARRLVIVAPAALRGMWTESLAATGMAATVVSYESLSRGRCGPPDADFVIADEAHHVRNPSTRRYRALASLCAGSPLLLISATPVHNRLGDLRAQLGLFLGQRARALGAEQLTRYIVKRDPPEFDERSAGDALPRIVGVRWFDVGDDAHVLQHIMHLPPPVPVEDGGDGGALIALSLVRQWASSRAALTGALRTRLAQATALLHAFEAGRYPTRAQLRAWCHTEGTLQLAFPELATDNTLPDAAALVDNADLHTRAVEDLLHRLSIGRDPDDDRAAALLRIRHSHPGASVVVFAEFAATVKSLYARLAPSGGVAMLTQRGGFVSGGRITRREILAQFAPNGSERVSPARRVTMLITTDLLSEGVNLQKANVVVHADLPWSPARCEQRVGRIRRLGSAHREVFVYALRLPAPAGRLLRLEQRLRRKISVAAHAIGVRDTIMPRLFSKPAVEAPSTIRAGAELTAILERWLCSTSEPQDVTTAVAAVRSTRRGFLAAVDWGEGPTLVAGGGSRITTVVARVRDAAAVGGGPALTLRPVCVDAVLRRLRAWCDGRAALGPLDLPARAPARSRRRLLQRIDAIAARSPRHLRSRYVPLAREARHAASSTFGAGAEQELVALTDARMPDEAWLAAVARFAGRRTGHVRVGEPIVLALLLLVPPTSSAAAADPP